MPGESFGDLGESSVGGIDRHVADDIRRAVKPERSVLDVEIDHRGTGYGAQKCLVFFLAHSGHIGEAVVLVDRLCVRVGGVEAAGEYIENRDGVPIPEPSSDRETEGKGRVVSVRGEDDDFEWLRMSRDGFARNRLLQSVSSPEEEYQKMNEDAAVAASICIDGFAASLKVSNGFGRDPTCQGIITSQ